MLVWFKTKSGVIIAVNPRLVRTVTQHTSDPSITRIWFDLEDEEQIVAPIVEVVAALNSEGA